MFTSPVSEVGMTVGSSSSAGQILVVQAFNDRDDLVSSAAVTLSPVMSPVSVTGSGIVRVVVSTSASVFVIDDLSFEEDSAPVTYDVYFGTNAGALTMIAANLTETTFDPGVLAFDTTYYWQVVASNAAGSVTGPLWQFTTTLDEVHFAWGAYSVHEAGGYATIVVERENPASGTVTVNYATADGTATGGLDYIGVSGTLTLLPDVLSTNFQVRVFNDILPEPAETVLISLSGPSPDVLLTSPSNSLLYILDDDAVRVSLFFNSDYVDTGTSTSGEAGNVIAALEEKNCDVRTFTGITAGALYQALVGADILYIPELESGDLASALSASARWVISNYVARGGALIINGQEASRDESLINGVFGHAIAAGSSGSSTFLTADAVGTSFEGGPSPIPQNSATYEWLRASLPAGALSVYQDSGDSYTTVAIVPHLEGKIIFLAYDWYDAVPRGSQDGGWDEVLRRAVLEAATLVDVPPIADAGPDQTNECSAVSTDVLLDGRGSFDPNGDPLSSCEWRLGALLVGTNMLQHVSLPLGVHEITLTVTDSAGASDSDTTQVTVVDTTPPLLACPTDVIEEFDDEHGAIATFTVVATDGCSAVDLVVTPPSGSLFPIGTTLVQSVATDVSGNQTSGSFDVVVLGAQGVKQNVLAELQVLLAECDDAAPSALLSEAVTELEDALDPARWIDQTHIVRERGDLVFHGEKNAVDALQRLIQRGSGCTTELVLVDAIDRLVQVDRLLAVISIRDAELAGVRPNKIAEDLNQLAIGDLFRERGLPELAIESYRHAWKHSVHMTAQLVWVGPDGTIEIGFLGIDGVEYAIQASTNLVDWELIGTAYADQEGYVHFVDPASRQYDCRYYRVVEP